LATGVAPGVTTGVEEEALSKRGLRWQTENEHAITCYNRWIAEHGLPLEEFRRF
jgi:post-segregation antitoxin (ccd killing protein)